MLGLSKIQLGFTAALLIVIGALCLGIQFQLSTIQTLKADNVLLEVNLDAVIRTNAENDRVASILRGQLADAQAVAGDNAKASLDALSELDRLKQDVSNVPDPSPTAPPCGLPATQLVLDRLRGKPAQDGHRNAAGPPPRPGDAVRLQGRSGGAGKGGG